MKIQLNFHIEKSKTFELPKKFENYFEEIENDNWDLEEEFEKWQKEQIIKLGGDPYDYDYDVMR